MSLGRSVFIKRNRVILSSVLIAASLVFVALMLLPVVGAFQQGNRTANNAANPAASPADQQKALEDQARGYELVLQREPDNQTALRGLLEVRIQQGNVQGAIAPLERLAKLNPDQTEYHVLLAQAKQQVGDTEGAAGVYRDILSRQPGDMNALQGLVGLMISQKRPEAAVALLQDTLKIADEQNKAKPGSINLTSVQLLLGQVYAEEERFNEAIAIYDEAIKTAGEDFRPLLGKAIVLRAAGRQDEAKPLFEQAASLAPAQYRDQISQLASGAQSPSDPANPVPEEPKTDAPSASPSGSQESSSPSRVTGTPSN
ncbi:MULTISPECIES: tetratricopeptide repeat protein [unclassified Leptolyngbya]|uniref:tetratricopeptide repeat protein n=1 Tax=unclassified Leptolyngbya TaxID=2650499 RepID=UPI0018EFC29C|nr:MULTISPECIES: tetratricopeptide repeat protein [unclassified Leptolyngbya]